MNRKHLCAAAALSAALIVATTGCSTKATAGTAGPAAAATPGVTRSTITLGALTDLSGPAASLGKPALQAEQIYLDDVNAAGGVCGRQVKVLAQDNSYDVQKAVTEYTGMQPKIALMSQLLGSPETDALLDSIERDKLPTLPAGPSSALLNHPHIQVVGATYDIGMVNGMDFLVKTAGLKSGDKVGLVFQPGEYGGDVEAGAKFVAAKYGVTLVEQQVSPTATDLTAQVTALKAAKVKAIVFAGTPPQTASLVGVAAAAGLQVPVMASGPAYVSQLLATPAAPALEKMLLIASQAPALNNTDPATTRLVKEYTAKYPADQLSVAVQVGAYSADVSVAALKASCDDLTRDGITKGLRSLTAFDDGIVGPEDFSDPAKASDTRTSILRPAAGVPGGLKTVQGATTSPLVAPYLASK